MDWFIYLHLNWNILSSLSAKSSLVIAAKGEHRAIGCQYDSVKSSTGYFVDISLEKWIGDDFLSISLSLVILIEVKILNVGKADGSFGLTLTSRMIVLI